MLYLTPRKKVGTFSKDWLRTISFGVLIIFTSLQISPAFATYHTYPDIEEKQLDNSPVYLENQDNNKEVKEKAIDLANKLSTLLSQIDKMNQTIIQTDTTKEKDEDKVPKERYGIIAYICQMPVEWLSYIMKNHGISGIVEGAPPVICKEFVKKSGIRLARGFVFSGEFRDAYSPTDTGIFLRRAPMELVRNTKSEIAPMIKDGNYLEVGKVMRVSLIDQMILSLLIQISIGVSVAPILERLGLDPNIANMVHTYLVTSNLGALTNEISGKTGENILALERKDQEYYPAFSNFILTYIFYIVLGLQRPGDEFRLQRLAMSESLASIITTIGIFVFLANDEQYSSKYGLLDMSNDTFADYRDISSTLIKKYGLSDYLSHAATTIGEGANILSESLIGGGDALRTRTIFSLFNLIPGSIAAANAQQTGRLAANNPEATKEITIQGLKANLWVDAVYFVYFVPSTLYYIYEGSLTKLFLNSILVINSLIQNELRVANEVISVRSKDEKSWFKTGGDIMTAIIPVGGYILMWNGFIRRNNVNRALIQLFSIVTATLFMAIEAYYGG